MTAVADIARVMPGNAAGIWFLRRAGQTNGAAVMLLHGIGSNATCFQPLIAALPASCDVIAWNAPGYAGSKPVTAKQPSPADYADALDALVHALDLPRLVLVGHSLGCLFAARYAASRPDRVRALALLSPALGYRVAPGATLPASVQARIDDLVALGPTAFAAKRAARLLHDPERKPQLLAAVRDAMAAVDPAGYTQAVHALGTGNLIADAARIGAPVTVAVGAEDVVTPPENARALHAALRRPVGFHEIPGAGHALPQENPAAVAGLLVELLERHGG
jgi:pimeloyl-ACP methyl ester carboxylesterase